MPEGVSRRINSKKREHTVKMIKKGRGRGFRGASKRARHSIAKAARSGYVQEIPVLEKEV